VLRASSRSRVTPPGTLKPRRSGGRRGRTPATSLGRWPSAAPGVRDVGEDPREVAAVVGRSSAPRR
jgi:hypothetical protein